MSEKNNWYPIAANILKSEMKLTGVTYAGLNSKLLSVGISETENTTRTKIARGSFSCGYFLQCLYALNIKDIDLEFYFKKLIFDPDLKVK